MIRKAKENDASEIVSVNINGWINTYKGIFPDEFLNNLNDSREESVLKCKEKINEYAVYEVDKKIVGIIRYGINKKGYDADYGEVYAIYVDNNYQRKQIGTKLINYVFKKMKKNYKYVLISTIENNSANIFYQKLGGEYVGKGTFSLDGKEYIENIYQFKIN